MNLRDPGLCPKGECRRGSAPADGGRLRVLLYEAYCSGVYGNQKYIHLLMGHLDPKLYEMVIACPAEGAFAQSVRAMGGSVTVVGAPARLRAHGGGILRPLSALAAFPEWIAYGFSLHRFLKKCAPDLIQCHNLRGVLLTGVPARLLGIPVIWYIKGEVVNPVLDWFGARLAAKILVLSAHLWPERYRNRFYAAGKVETLLSGLETGTISASRTGTADAIELPGPSQAVKMAYAGVLCAAKGMEVLIEAFADAAARVSEISLYLIGSAEDGVYFESLKSLAVRRGVSDRVFFLGWRDRAVDILREMDVYVLPSRSEGVPRSIIEAMMLGKPVIATDVGAVRDLVGDGETGFVVPKDDRRALAARMEELGRDASLRRALGESGRRRVEGHFGIDEHIAHLCEIYRGLSRKKHPGGAGEPSRGR